MEQQLRWKRNRLRFTISSSTRSPLLSPTNLLVFLILLIFAISGINSSGRIPCSSSSSSSSSITGGDNLCSLAGKAQRDHQEVDDEEIREAKMEMEEQGAEVEFELAAGTATNNNNIDTDDIGRMGIGGIAGMSISSRRNLGGPGSSPPRCTSKCGKCTPCKPVHVPVPPGTPVTAEYYPEAWRCKCGNKLYMP
ncbi:uncharacterized protein LOC116198909 [Punica granatum]|uniref:Epidermal patterning factor-like protein n=1 Tax=Punica granatum TaxID=22663 RepID=A0A6P8CS74_PUNGR|nr:uncharacterized protein LOC116198909 [Punica granatum]